MTPEQIEIERKAFEAYASDDGKWPKAVERNSRGDYLLAYTASTWNVWLARAEKAQRVREALERIAARCPTDHADYTIASIGDAARAALKD